MTSVQRMVASQLAAALHDALPPGAFDEPRFLADLAAAVDAGDAQEGAA